MIDQTHNFSASALYRLSFGRGQRFGSSASAFAQAITGGWQVNAIAHLASGFPMRLSTGVNNSGTELGFLGNRPDQICSGKLSHSTPQEFFNTNCFVDPPAVS